MTKYAQRIPDNVSRIVTWIKPNAEKFAKGVSNENVNKIYDIALENGALGGKLTGAGGGGHMLFYCEKSKHDRFIQKMEDIGLKHIRFKFNNDGPKVLNLYDYSGK